MTAGAPLLIIGHPGHEVRCHGWMSRHRPLTLVLTSGGGASKAGRAASTRTVVEAAGARCSALFGNFSDQEVYGCMLRGDADPLAEWTGEAARLIAAQRPDLILTDMVEGYNSSHDLLAYLVDAAVAKAVTLGWKAPRVLAQPLMGRPDQAWQGKLRPVETIELDEAELTRKLAAAEGYPELRAEVEHALRELGPAAFRQECLYATETGEALLRSLPEPTPFYEKFGEEQVRRGKYAHVIRHRGHLVPLALAVRARLGIG